MLNCILFRETLKSRDAVKVCAFEIAFPCDEKQAMAAKIIIIIMVMMLTNIIHKYITLRPGFHSIQALSRKIKNVNIILSPATPLKFILSPK